jgi:hypothetical protein
MRKKTWIVAPSKMLIGQLGIAISGPSIKVLHVNEYEKYLSGRVEGGCGDHVTGVVMSSMSLNSNLY